MLGRWLLRRAVARIAIVSLAVGLVALATLTVWSTSTTRATTQRVREFNEVSAHWNSVFTHVSVEDTFVRDFLTAGGSERRSESLATVMSSAEPDLRWLDSRGGDAEVPHVRRLRPWYTNYTRLIRAMLASAPTHQLAGYQEQAMLDFATLRDQIVANVQRKQHELTDYLREVSHINTTLRWVAAVVVTFDLLLCSMSAWILIAYQRRAEREAAKGRHDALHDPLTGLANRQLLADRSMQAISEAKANGGGACLLFIDLDQFKHVNDSLGHQYGDQLLVVTANRLTTVARHGDVVARLGGDEFAILMPTVTSTRDVLAVAERVCDAIGQPVDLGVSRVTVGASVGAATFPADCDNVEELLRHADAAMYVAKRGGLGVRMYDPSWEGVAPDGGMPFVRSPRTKPQHDDEERSTNLRRRTAP